MAAAYRLISLGSVQLLDGDGAVVAASAKALALLAWLARRRDRRAHREQLVDLLWSDADEARGRQSLRQALSQLRTRLDASQLKADGDYVVLADGIEVDAVAFEAAVSARDLAQASALYAGPFFDRFALPGASEFEQWADLERRRLAGLWAGLLDGAAQECLDRGAARDARRLALRLREAEPGRERPWRLGIEAAILAGDLAVAKADAVTLAELLSREERTAEPATARLLARVERGTMPPGPEPAAGIEGDLIGREAQFAHLVDAAAQMRAQQRSRRVEVEAPPGLGKSRLLRDVARRLPSVGLRVLADRARPSERAIPYAFVARLVRALAALPGSGGVHVTSAAALVAIDPSVQSLFPAAGREAASEEDQLRTRTLALADLLASVCAERPLALLLDDWQWADERSRTVLNGALEADPDVPLLAVLAQRGPGGVDSRDDGTARRLALPPWTPDEVRAFLESIASAEDAAEIRSVADVLQRATGGSPLRCCHVLALAAERGLAYGQAGVWRMDVERLLPWLGSLDLIGEQTRGLGEEERAILLALAVAEGPVRRSVLAEMLPGTVERVHAALAVGGWVVETGDTLSLAHDELARSMLAVVPPEAARDARLRLARAEAAIGPDERAGFQRTARLLASGGDEATLDALFLRWWRSPMEALAAPSVGASARLLLGEDATPARIRRFSRLLPLAERLGGTRRPTLIMTGGVAALALVLGGAVWQGRAPARVRWVTAPLAVTSEAAMPTPAIELLDRDGRRLRRSGDTVRISSDSGERVWRGAVAVTHQGLATFPGFRFDSSGVENPQRLLIAQSGTLRPDTAGLVWGARLKILFGTVNGQPVDSLHSVAVVPGAENIRVAVTTRVTTPWTAAAVTMVAIPTWGPPARSWVSVGPVATPTRDAIQRAAFTVPPPPRAGRHYVFLMQGAEPGAEWLASGTNWKVGAPVWGDGNDVGSWGFEEAESIRRGLPVTARMRMLYDNGFSPLGGGVDVIAFEYGGPPAPPRRSSP